jgi:hypothetical protein
VKDFVEDLDKQLRKLSPAIGLSKTQKLWIGFCILSIALSNSVCWKKFERISFGKYTHSALSWMCNNSKIAWTFLLRASVTIILSRYGITEGVLVLDDTDKKRSKSTKKIYKAHKIKDKGSGGYINGQAVVMLILVSPSVTLPVGFDFYTPDPELKKWKTRDKELRKKGIKKKERPPEPKRNEKYPKKETIGLNLLRDFHRYYPQVEVKCLIGDALYSTDDFVTEASEIFGGIQVLSKLKKNQNVHFRGKKLSVKEYFSKYPCTAQKIKIRGGEEVNCLIGSARLHVPSHGKKRFVIALKYEKDEDYRYLFGTDLSWRTLDIVQAHTLRWLVEVFFQDWKSYEGWGQLTKQQGEEGSNRGLILSLLLDHCLLLHPEQVARIENKLPAYTVGSLQEVTKLEVLFNFVQDIIYSDNPEEALKSLAERAKEIFQLALSKKHMVNRNLGRLEATLSLKYRVKAVLAST